VIEIKPSWIALPTLEAATSNDTFEVPQVQVIPIIWPILASAFLTGLLLGWVLFVALPRMRRAEKNTRRAPKPMRHPAGTTSRSPTTTLVDADQQAGPRTM
jgi:hypothetical protein